MSDTTIVTNSPVGKRLDAMAVDKPLSYLMFNKQRIKLVKKITLGRDTVNDIVVDNKLASRHHALIQKIKDAYFLKDSDSTNGTFVNGKRVPSGKYVKLHLGDKITIGTASLVIS